MAKTQNIINLETDLKPRILVVGVGGAGGNAVNNTIRSKLEGVDFIVMNTDAQALQQSLAPSKIQLGIGITQGLGAGSKPDVGKAAAEETLDEFLPPFNNCNMVFITAGMGGGTGTGAAPVIARAAREQGILTIGVVTKPFHFEGSHRMKTAEEGIAELQQYVDTLIIIPNQNLFRIANERTTFADAFKLADDVLYSGVRGVTDLMIMPGLINLDFADVRSVMGEKGKAMMGTGEADGEGRALQAAEAAISNPLLDDVSMKGARGVLISITGGYDMTLYEVDEAANRIREEVDPEANIIFGSTFDEKLTGRMRVSIVATGIDALPHHISPFKLHSPAPHITSRNHEEISNSSLHQEDPLNSYSYSDTSVSRESLTFSNSEKEKHFSEEKSEEEEETTSFYPASLTANRSEESEKKEPKKTLSLFERLTGANRRQQAEKKSPSDSKVAGEVKNSNFDFKDEEDSELLEIPAFLRRQDSK